MPKMQSRRPAERQPLIRVYHEETFAPVKAIVRLDGEEAAITCANESARGWRVAQRIEAFTELHCVTLQTTQRSYPV